MAMNKNKKKPDKADKQSDHPYFSGHQCKIESFNSKAYETQYGRVRRCLLDLVAVRSPDIRARNLYRSYAGLRDEKYRQCVHYPFSIHPFSEFRLGVDIFCISLVICSNLLLSALYCKEITKPKTVEVTMIKVLEGFFVLHVVINFFTGYVEGNTAQHVVLDLRKIACKYLRTTFIIDTMSAAGMFTYLYNSTVASEVTLTSFKVLRLFTLYTYLNNFLAVIQAGIALKTATELVVLLNTYLVWNIYFQHAVEYVMEDSFAPENPRNCSWLTIAKLWNATTVERFVYSLDRAVGMLRQNSNFNLIDEKGCFEAFFVVAWIIAKLLVVHCGLKYLIAVFVSESARSKYFMMSQQVETYMNQRKFPPRIKKKILKFYALRFQSHFFVESRMMACVSGQLREDIIMDTGRQLVSDVDVLKKLPRALLLQIGIKLKIVIFIVGDIIFKINTVGDCLYFIDKGTVAIYSESGKEVCHLQDGDFFGEIALVLKNRFRTASAVAVTNCELFRLDREDFETSIACYPTVYENIQKVATNRFERTNVLDEHHKSELRIEKTQRKI